MPVEEGLHTAVVTATGVLLGRAEGTLTVRSGGRRREGKQLWSKHWGGGGLLEGKVSSVASVWRCREA